MNAVHIPLSGVHGHGLFAVVDEDITDAIAQYRWHLTAQGYASRRLTRSECEAAGKVAGSQIALHRFVLALHGEEGREIDHINGICLDNRYANLRCVTHRQNSMNSLPRKGSSRFKGVSFCGQTGRWKAQIAPDGVNYNLGRFTTEEEAARAYDSAARTHFGEFAKLNYPQVQADEWARA